METACTLKSTVPCSEVTTVGASRDRYARPRAARQTMAISGPPLQAVRPGRSCSPTGPAGLRRVAAELRRRRAELRAEWEACLGDLQSDGGSHPDGDEPSERECSAFTIRTLEHLSQRIKEVDRALERLDSGLYGVCVECECPVSKERLRANPLAARCISCQERVEKVGRCRAI